MQLNIKFTETGEVVILKFSNTPKLCDIFIYKEAYFMVADYDGKFLHVVKVVKHDVIE